MIYYPFRFICFLIKWPNYPFSAGDTGNGLICEGADCIAETNHDFVQTGKDLIAKATLTDSFPTLLNGIHLRRIW